mmetsp:Transcript_12493/g.26303  ORF Transcript_12493/g.26303 Transcript_12493/m.26303 type:complete len:396 (-) Transcript_12493:11-1198(-)
MTSSSPSKSAMKALWTLMTSLAFLSRKLPFAHAFQSTSFGINSISKQKLASKSTIQTFIRLSESNYDTKGEVDPSVDDATASLSTTAIESNPFLSLLSKGLRKTSIATNKSTSDRVFKSSLSLQRMRQQIQQLTYVAPSSIGDHAGLGLFASKNIKAGTVVGLYPAHALGYELVVNMNANGNEVGERGEEFQDLSLFLAESEEDEAYFQENPHGNSPYLHATDQPLFQRKSLISTLFDGETETPPPLYLDVNPKRNEELDSAWTSHYINDGASLLDCRGKITEGDIEQYYLQSTKSKNCIHIPFGPSPVLATVTTKKVKKNQELFTSYGVVYWLGTIDTSHMTNEGQESISMPEMTEKIQEQILESARDLQKAMAGAKATYETEMSALEIVFREL